MLAVAGVSPECLEDWGPQRNRGSLSLRVPHPHLGLLLVVLVGIDSNSAALRGSKTG